MLKRFLFLSGLVLMALFVFLQTRSSEYRVERSVVVLAPQQEVYRYLEDLHQWPRWSPWDSLDPKLKRSFGGVERGKGASYFWDGDAQVGKGRLTITEVAPPSSVHYGVQFEVPFETTMKYQFTVMPQGGGSKVTWAFFGEHPFWAKLFTLFFDAEQQVGTDMRRGLADLKRIIETK